VSLLGEAGFRITRKRACPERVKGCGRLDPIGILPAEPSGDTVKARRSSSRTEDAPHVERAYRDLKAGIVKGRYRPGASLSEVSLASEHGMSRTPIREGLARLGQEGYLERVVGHGYFVARVTVQQIHDTFDLRRPLDGAARA